MKISLVVPVYNEEEAIPIFYKSVREHPILNQYDIEIVFINDGSKDSTGNIINALAIADPLVLPLNFTRNFGKEPAFFAGLEHATGEAVIPIDVNLQDPIDVIPLLIKMATRRRYCSRKRADRSSDTWLKRKTAEWFYKLHNKISSPEIEENVGDFRLISRQSVEYIKLLPERNLFMKGILSWVGGKLMLLNITELRSAGESKFNGWKLWNLALEGVTSFSTFPLRVWTYIGLFVALVSFIYGGWMMVDKLIWGNPVPGYPSLLVSILFLGGVQLIGIGVLGEYIGRIYIESKQRPKYILKNIKNGKF
ncbi:glycosyltransferase family 2 protein [Providencia rettgeri]|nr:glycosyltransferase family 2 protein [Providencia rettgeri]